jgi:FlaG/FlaF family flagellin (archaellin)
MNFERCKVRLRSDKSGVSEVVGNILILMITVILFSSIVMYVNQIPVPETTTKADFAASITFETSGTTTASLTVTHAGGVSMRAVDTAILLHVDSSTLYYKLSEDADFDHTDWYMGIDWTKDFTVPSPASEITVTVIDLEKYISVWVSQVSGGTGGNAPIVLQRYADSLYTTPSADPVLRNDNFSLFAKIIDLDNDLDTSSVYVDASNIGGDPEKYADAETSDGWFRFDFMGEDEGFVSDTRLVDGKIVKFYASDDAGHTTISSYMMSVTVLPSDTTIVPIETLPFEGGLPSYITWMSDGQGIGIYHADNVTGLINVSEPGTVFAKDEKVYIRVASLRLNNIGGTNSLILVDTRTGFIYTPNYVGSSVASLPFYGISSAGGAFMYECQFDTVGLPPSAYSMTISLKSTGSTTMVFQTTQTIIVTEDGSSISFSPDLWLFSNEERTIPWGTKTQPFDLSVLTSSRVYVSVKVQDAASTPDPSVEDIMIVDMRGDTQLDGTPPSGNMLSPWEADPTPSYNQTYEFEIDLRLNNGDQWIGGTHAYTLKIARFADVNEGVYSLSKMVYVRANTAKADFFIGAAGYVTGTSNFVDPQYLYQVVNNNFFSLRSLYDYSNAPSAADCYATSALALGDIDGDGDKDILMGQYGSHKLYFIENSLNTFGSWQDATIIQRPTTDDTNADINWIATGDTNGDGDIDFAYSTSYYSGMGRKVIVYNNTYGATGVVFKSYGTADDGVRKIALEDMTGDGRADLIVLGEGRIQVFDLHEWDPSSPIAQIPDTGANWNIIDFDIADVNYDGMLDILTVDNTANSEDCVKGVVVSYYNADTASFTERLLTNCTADPYWGEADDVYDQTSATFSVGGNALILSESPTTDPDLDARGKLNWTCQLSAPLTANTDQQLKVRAKVSSGAVEGFYIWYSTDGTVYIPLIYIAPTETEFQDHTVWLPDSVIGKQIYLRVTDSISTNESGGEVDTVYLDYVAVLTDTFGDYSTYKQVFTQADAFICVRAGNINGNEAGDLGLEIIVAKDATTPTSWKVRNRTAASPDTWSDLAGWSGGSATFFCKGDTKIDLHSSMNSDESPVRTILTKSAPRLFVVTDINGDGYDDILVVNTTINAAITSQVALFLNMQGSGVTPWWYCVVKDIAAEYNIADVRGGMTYLAVENLLLS